MDISTPLDQAVALSLAIPGAGLQRLPAGHLSNLEQPEAFTGLLRAHLESV
jgi:pimeloyl-ACP methyl ester carboxylesterase